MSFVTSDIYDKSPHDFKQECSASASQIMERCNMRDGIVHGAFFYMATAFADPFAIIPLFLAGFTDSHILIGFVVSLVGAASVLPQIAVAGYLRHHPGSAKRLMLGGIWTRCVVWGVIAAITLAVPDPGVGVLIAFMVGVSIYSLGGGVAVLPFKQVISGTITPEHRSSFFGWRLVTGGIMSIIAGLIVKKVLGMQSMPWPRNYGLLFLFSFISLAIAYIAMSRFRFAPLPDSDKLSGKSYRQELQHVWKRYPILKQFIITRLFSGGLQLALPFFVLYATQEAGISLTAVGFFIVAQKSGAIISNMFWMPLGNRTGTKSVIICGLILAVLSLTSMLFFNAMAGIIVAFVLAGASMSAMSVGFGGYILELGTSEIRPLLYAMEGTLLMPLYFMPLFGGWLADVFGFEILLGSGVVLLMAALIMTIKLCEPREGGKACGPFNKKGPQQFLRIM